MIVAPSKLLAPLRLPLLDTGSSWYDRTMSYETRVAVGRSNRVTDRRATITWRDVWLGVKASAERRLGRHMLRVYLALALFGLGVVVASVVAMRL